MKMKIMTMMKNPVMKKVHLKVRLRAQKVIQLAHRRLYKLTIGIANARISRTQLRRGKRRLRSRKTRSRSRIRLRMMITIRTELEKLQGMGQPEG